MRAVRLMATSSLGMYYAVGDKEPVTVRVSANWPTTVCFSHRSTECVHVEAVNQYLSQSATGGQET